MNIFAKPVAILGVAGAVALAIPTVSSAQTPFDIWSHVVNPTPEGLCWIPTDLGPYKEYGYGYWGACPASVKASPAMRARAQAVRTSQKKKRYR